MIHHGVDYSRARPDPACLRNAGNEFAIRYTSIGDSTKNMTPPEVQKLVQADLAIVTVFEETAGDMLGGVANGLSAAQWSRNTATACGMPAGRPHYFALDIDPRPLKQDDWRSIQNYLDGAAQVLGRNNVGIYGGYMAIEQLVPAWAAWGWQTFAWSAGQLSKKAVLYQYRNGFDLCGGTVDLNRAYKDDYGQWGLNMPLTKEDKDWFVTVLKNLVSEGDRPVPPTGQTHPNLRDITDALNDFRKTLIPLADDEANIVAAILGTDQSPSDEQMQHLADILSARLPASVLDLLRQRLES